MKLLDENVMQVQIKKDWKIFFDGASRGISATPGDNTDKSSGIDIVFVTPNNVIIMHSLTLIEGCSNNETKYKTLIASLDMALEIPIDDLMVYGDSDLGIR